MSASRKPPYNIRNPGQLPLWAYISLGVLAVAAVILMVLATQH